MSWFKSIVVQKVLIAELVIVQNVEETNVEPFKGLKIWSVLHPCAQYSRRRKPYIPGYEQTIKIRNEAAVVVLVAIVSLVELTVVFSSLKALHSGPFQHVLPPIRLLVLVDLLYPTSRPSAPSTSLFLRGKL